MFGAALPVASTLAIDAVRCSCCRSCDVADKKADGSMTYYLIVRMDQGGPGRRCVTKATSTSR
jgi:hypothetical protein